MAKLSRRRLIGQTAAVAGAAAVVGRTVGQAAPGPHAASRSAAQDGKTEITVYHIWGTPPGGTPAATPHPMTQVIDAFNAQSTTVTLTSLTPGSYYETLQKTQADLAAGNPPDLVSVPWAFLNYAVEGLGVKDLATIAGDSFASLQASMDPTAWELVTKDETVYGFPWGLSTPIFYYNADVFEAAGVDPAVAFDTWEAFAAEAPKLQEALGGNPVLALSYNKDWPAQTLIQSNGGRVMNDDGTFGFTSPEAKEAMQTIADLDKAGLYDRGTTEELRPSFVAGSTAVMQASVAALSGLNNDVPFTLGTSTWPKFGEKPVIASTGGSFLGIFTDDEAKYPAVVEFLTFCASEAGYSLWNQTGYVNISNLELDRVPGQEPAYAQFEAGLIRETNWPSARGVEAGSTWDGYCERMWANDISVEDGVNQALEEINAIIGA
jgi:multiple sugar transport system substrate-binding protein